MAESFRDFEHHGWEDPSVCAQYDDYFARLTTQSVAALLEAARVGGSDHVLDVATGPGYVAGAAASRAVKVVGVDFSARQVEMARNRYPGITFQQGDAGDLPFDSASFDVVVSNFGMPHFPGSCPEACGKSESVLRSLRSSLLRNVQAERPAQPGRSSLLLGC